MAAEGQLNDFTEPGTQGRSCSGADIASAATIVPLKKIHRVTGTVAITLIALPYPEFEGTIILVPTGAFTGATGGSPTAVNKAIGLAFTAVVGKPLVLTYVASQQLWYPGY